MAPIDLTGGLAPESDHPLQEPPSNPDIRESASMWIYDDAGRFAIPRIAVEALGGHWQDRGVKVNIAFPGGRVLHLGGGFSTERSHSSSVRQMSIDAGPLTFTMVAPFRRWKMQFDGEAAETTVERQLAREKPTAIKRVRISLDAEMSTPPWTPGEQAIRADDTATTLAIGAVGGRRHEQLFLCSGKFHVEGEEPLDLSGRGLRVLRSGVRSTGDFPGHCWQSAVFPSGRAFGVLAFPPRKNEAVGYSEAFIFDGRRKAYPTAVKVPWMEHRPSGGDNLDLALEGPDGVEFIRGVAHCTTVTAPGSPLFGDWKENGQTPTLGDVLIHQGGALYEWDGEQAYGMVERSFPADRVSNYSV